MLDPGIAQFNGRKQKHYAQHRRGPLVDPPSPDYKATAASAALNVPGQTPHNCGRLGLSFSTSPSKDQASPKPKGGSRPAWDGHVASRRPRRGRRGLGSATSAPGGRSDGRRTSDGRTGGRGRPACPTSPLNGPLMGVSWLNFSA